MQNNKILICSAQIINKTGVTRQCKNKCKIDYCHIHSKLQIVTPIKNHIDITLLDEKFKHNLMGMYESWNEVDKNEIICMDDDYWEIDTITSHFTYHLNNSNMENPYPIYPNSPFNRKIFSVNSLIILKNKLKELKKPVNIALKLLLNQSYETLQSIYQNININNFSNDLLELFKSKYRYMLINSKNSQDIYTGLWVQNKMPLTQFEKLYESLNNMPYQLIVNSYIVTNNARSVVEKKMLLCKTNFNMLDKKFCEIL